MENQIIKLIKVYISANILMNCVYLVEGLSPRITVEESKPSTHIPRGPHVCFPERAGNPCCSGWKQRFRGGPCIQALCSPPCMGGLCVEPNLCLCRDGHRARSCSNPRASGPNVKFASKHHASSRGRSHKRQPKNSRKRMSEEDPSSYVPRSSRIGSRRRNQPLHDPQLDGKYTQRNDAQSPASADYNNNVNIPNNKRSQSKAEINKDQDWQEDGMQNDSPGGYQYPDTRGDQQLPATGWSQPNSRRSQSNNGRSQPNNRWSQPTDRRPQPSREYQSSNSRSQPSGRSYQSPDSWSRLSDPRYSSPDTRSRSVDRRIPSSDTWSQPSDRVYPPSGRWPQPDDRNQRRGSDVLSATLHKMDDNTHFDNSRWDDRSPRLSGPNRHYDRSDTPEQNPSGYEDYSRTYQRRREHGRGFEPIEIPIMMGRVDRNGQNSHDGYIVNPYELNVGDEHQGENRNTYRGHESSHEPQPFYDPYNENRPTGTAALESDVSDTNIDDGYNGMGNPNERILPQPIYNPPCSSRNCGDRSTNSFPCTNGCAINQRLRLHNPTERGHTRNGCNRARCGILDRLQSAIRTRCNNGDCRSSRPQTHHFSSRTQCLWPLCNLNNPYHQPETIIQDYNDCAFSNCNNRGCISNCRSRACGSSRHPCNSRLPCGNVDGCADDVSNPCEGGCGPGCDVRDCGEEAVVVDNPCPDGQILVSDGSYRVCKDMDAFFTDALD